MEKESDLHKRHRMRLRARYRAEGLTHFDPHNILELLLFYSIPRCNTNDIAHLLLDRFGSLSGVFRATREELCQIKGVGENTAMLICLLRDIQIRCKTDQATGTLRFADREALASYLADLYAPIRQETVYALFFNAKEELALTEKLFEGSVETCSVRKRQILEIGMRTGASFFVLAHNHPLGETEPSAADYRTTHSLSRLFRELDMPLADHAIVCGQKVTFLREDPVRLSD